MGTPVSPDVTWFFEEYVPERLAADAERAGGIDGRCEFDLADAGSYTVDFGAQPPAKSPDCRLRLSAGDLEAMVQDPFSGQVRAWQGRLRTEGDQGLLRRMADVLFPLPPGENSAYAGYYASLARLIPDPRLTFMNHGYAERAEDFAELEPDERPWGYSVNLVRRALRHARLPDAAVLDVGCGRGGAAAYVARQAPSVVGVDASRDAIAFCRRRHQRPNLRFVHGYADRLPLPDAAVDVVLSVESAHCYLDRPAFIREVTRVLRPGGCFCFADIVQGDEETLIAQQPGLRLSEDADITAEVARAIDLNRESLAALLTSTIDEGLGNAAIVHELIRSVNVAIYRNYVSGRWGYHVWHVEREET